MHPSLCPTPASVFGLLLSAEPALPLRCVYLSALIVPTARHVIDLVPFSIDVALDHAPITRTWSSLRLGCQCRNCSLAWEICMNAHSLLARHWTCSTQHIPSHCLLSVIQQGRSRKPSQDAIVQGHAIHKSKSQVRQTQEAIENTPT